MPITEAVVDGLKRVPGIITAEQTSVICSDIHTLRKRRIEGDPARRSRGQLPPGRSPVDGSNQAVGRAGEELGWSQRILDNLIGSVGSVSGARELCPREPVIETAVQ